MHILMLKIYDSSDFVISITISLASYYHHASGYFGGLPVANCSSITLRSNFITHSTHPSSLFNSRIGKR